MASRHEFDSLSIPARPRITLNRATVDDVEATAHLLQTHLLHSTAPNHAIARVICSNRDSVLVFTRNERIVGFCAMLMLSPLGLEALLLGDFDPLDPKTNWLAVTGEQPTAIYGWAIVAPKGASEGILHVSEFLRKLL